MSSATSVVAGSRVGGVGGEVDVVDDEGGALEDDDGADEGSEDAVVVEGDARGGGPPEGDDDGGEGVENGRVGAGAGAGECQAVCCGVEAGGDGGGAGDEEFEGYLEGELANVHEVECAVGVGGAGCRDRAIDEFPRGGGVENGVAAEDLGVVSADRGGGRLAVEGGVHDQKEAVVLAGGGVGGGGDDGQG